MSLTGERMGQAGQDGHFDLPTIPPAGARTAFRGAADGGGRTGRGQQVDISLMDSPVACLHQATYYYYRAQPPRIGQIPMPRWRPNGCFAVTMARDLAPANDGLSLPQADGSAGKLNHFCHRSALFLGQWETDTAHAKALDAENRGGDSRVEQAGPARCLPCRRGSGRGRINRLGRGVCRSAGDGARFAGRSGRNAGGCAARLCFRMPNWRWTALHRSMARMIRTASWPRPAIAARTDPGAQPCHPRRRPRQHRGNRHQPERKGLRPGDLAEQPQPPRRENPRQG